jgi:hypothetical protein
MPRIVEHRSALPNGPIIALHIRTEAGGDPAVFATVAVEVFGQRVNPDEFPGRLPVSDAYLQALAYAERSGIAVIWIDDPLRLFPPDKRPIGDGGG